MASWTPVALRRRTPGAAADLAKPRRLGVGSDHDLRFGSFRAYEKRALGLNATELRSLKRELPV